MYGVFFFFFKQKTAYEMRIGDWSSDVCSSDLAELLAVRALRQHREAGEAHVLGHAGFAVMANIEGTQDLAGEVLAGVDRDVMVLVAERPQAFDAQAAAAEIVSRLALLGGYLHSRSEEHTSELQSLLRIS